MQDHLILSRGCQLVHLKQCLFKERKILITTWFAGLMVKLINIMDIEQLLSYFSSMFFRDIS